MKLSKMLAPAALSILFSAGFSNAEIKSIDAIAGLPAWKDATEGITYVKLGDSVLSGRDLALAPADIASRLPGFAEAVTAAVEERITLTQALDMAAFMRIEAKDAPVVRFILDPECGDCAPLWKSLNELAEAGKITLNVLLVPAVSADSFSTIAAIAKSEDPRAELDKVMSGTVLAPARMSDVPKDKAALVEVALNIMQQMQLTSIPVVSYTLDGEDVLIQGIEGDKFVRKNVLGEDIELPELVEAGAAPVGDVKDDDVKK